MAKDFDDFVLWERDDPDSIERGSRLAKNCAERLGNSEDSAKLIAALLLLVDDMVTEKLRSYHRWLEQ